MDRLKSRKALVRKASRRLMALSAQPPVRRNVTNANRKRLTNAFKAGVMPMLDRGASAKSRLRYDQIVVRYLKNVEPCMRAAADGSMFLARANGQPIVTFGNRIGSDSRYGVAYVNMGKGLARLLKFASKLMADTPEHAQEIRLLRAMSALVRNSISPNMPIMHTGLLCTSRCMPAQCPAVLKGAAKYWVVMSELADAGDVETWLRQPRDLAAYESVIAQMMLAMHAFHGLGYTHGDCHLGNFLVHTVKPGGYWYYRLEGQTVFVLNTGFQVVLWDPGMAMRSGAASPPSDDFMRAATLLIYTTAGLYPRSAGVVPPPVAIGRSLRRALTLPTRPMPTMLKALEYGSVVVGAKTPPGYVLNVKPYVLRGP